MVWLGHDGQSEKREGEPSRPSRPLTEPAIFFWLFSLHFMAMVDGALARAPQQSTSSLVSLSLSPSSPLSFSLKLVYSLSSLISGGLPLSSSSGVVISCMRRLIRLRQRRHGGPQLRGGWTVTVATRAMCVAMLWLPSFAPPSLATPTANSTSQQVPLYLIIIMVPDKYMKMYFYCAKLTNKLSFN